jgi:hypothetical protein
VPAGSVRGVQRRVEVSTRMPTPEQLAQAKALMARPASKDEFAEGAEFTFDRVIALRQINAAEAGAHPALEITVLAFGNVAFVALPCEFFTELGRRIKKASPFEYTFVCTHADGSWGYIGEKHNYEEGGYEMTSSLFAPGSGETLADAAVELLREAHRNPAQEAG